MSNISGRSLKPPDRQHYPKHSGSYNNKTCHLLQQATITTRANAHGQPVNNAALLLNFSARLTHTLSVDLRIGMATARAREMDLHSPAISKLLQTIAGHCHIRDLGRDPKAIAWDRAEECRRSPVHRSLLRRTRASEAGNGSYRTTFTPASFRISRSVPSKLVRNDRNSLARTNSPSSWLSVTNFFQAPVWLALKNMSS